MPSVAERDQRILAAYRAGATVIELALPKKYTGPPSDSSSFRPA